MRNYAETLYHLHCYCHPHHIIIIIIISTTLLSSSPPPSPRHSLRPSSPSPDSSHRLPQTLVAFLKLLLHLPQTLVIAFPRLSSSTLSIIVIAFPRLSSPYMSISQDRASSCWYTCSVCFIVSTYPMYGIRRMGRDSRGSDRTMDEIWTPFPNEKTKTPVANTHCWYFKFKTNGCVYNMVIEP